MMELEKARVLFNERFMSEVKKEIIGYEEEIRQIVICLLSGGPRLRTHVLLEAVPGVGKTELAKTIAKIIGGEFKRIQGTPDLLPTDISGVPIWDANKRCFETQKGPVFTNILLVDEINRMVPRAQTALLEVMQEGAVTIRNETYILTDPFIVLATQNPIEHEATFLLPEAQLDRFTMKIRFGYTSRDNEIAILGMRNEDRPPVNKIVEADEIVDLRKLIRQGTKIDDRHRSFIVDLVRATRPEGNPDMVEKVSLGGSVRPEIAVEAASRVHAFLGGREFVLPEDISEVSLPILRHRIMVNTLEVPEGKKHQDFVDDLIKGIITRVRKESGL